MRRITTLVQSIPDVTWTLQLKIQFIITIIALGTSIYGLKFFPDPDLRKYFFMTICGIVGYWLPGGGDAFQKDKIHWNPKLTIQLVVSAAGFLVVLGGLRTIHDKNVYNYLFGLMGTIIFFWLPGGGLKFLKAKEKQDS